MEILWQLCVRLLRTAQIYVSASTNFNHNAASPFSLIKLRHIALRHAVSVPLLSLSSFVSSHNTSRLINIGIIQLYSVESNAAK